MNGYFKIPTAFLDHQWYATFLSPGCGKPPAFFSPSLVNEIQATEFTNWDAYSLNIFNANYTRPAVCVEADPNSQFCQLVGKYRMQLPDYNSVEPYPHMREKCPSIPPKYIKPTGC